MCAMFNLLSQRNAGHRPKYTWLHEITFVHEVGMLIMCCLHGYKILFTGHEPEIANYNSSAVLKKGTPILTKSVISTYIPKRTKKHCVACSFQKQAHLRAFISVARWSAFIYNFQWAYA